MKNTIDFSASTSAYVEGWIVKALCQSAWQGLNSMEKNISDNGAEAREIFEKGEESTEICNARLNQLEEYSKRSEEQQGEFQNLLDINKAKYREITGSDWQPYTSKRNTGKAQNTTNSYWAKQLDLKPTKKMEWRNTKTG